MKNKHLKYIILMLVISIVITFIFNFAYGGNNFQLITILLNILYGIIIGTSISLSGIISQFITSKYDISKNPIKTYVILLIVIFLYITIDVLLVNVLWYRFVLGLPLERIMSSTSIMISSIITIFLGLTIFFIILSKIFISKFLKSEEERQSAIMEAEFARFETLKSQINPHFLFNSLNTLSTLILIDPKRADEFTSKLSNIYRYVLDNQDNDLVPVTQEIEFARDYIKLQAIRFSNNFTINIEEFSGDSNSMIIPLSLQLLLENIFKHNIISQKNKLAISIYFENGFIVVHNTKTAEKEIRESYSVGLSNILNRYEIVCDEDCVIEDNTKSFIVKLPLVLTD